MINATPSRCNQGTNTENINEVSGMIVDAAYQIHSRLGPGLLESVYETILASKLSAAGLRVERQRAVPIVFDGLEFQEGFRADLDVENRIIVELKSVEQLAPVHGKQLLTYLRLLDYRLGLLINFGAPYLKDGIVRIANKL